VFVPVVDANQQPLMPTIPSRARRWVKSGKATPFWKKGIFYVRLNVEPSSKKTQQLAIGVDPGSKKEGYTVKSKKHTFLNVQVDAVTWVKDRIKTRREMRRARRTRSCPYRKPCFNKVKGGLAPSTKARWQWKLRIINWLCKLYPVTDIVIEDIKARTWKNAKKWNISFSPLEVGKAWFYGEIAKLAKLHTLQGWETKELRDLWGLRKTGKKLAEIFEAHCVDSWCLANQITRGASQPDNKSLFCVTPIRYSRRQLHMLQPAKGGVRKKYGGTISHGFKKASLVKHLKHGLCYIGGSGKTGVSLHSIETGKRICQNAKVETIKFLSFNTHIRRQAIPPKAKALGLLA
jgi:hypothetical protein